MDNLSNLLKEAKPLYKKRKRQNFVVKTTLALCLPMMFFVGCYTMYEEGNNIYLSIVDESLQNELINDEFALYR